LSALAFALATPVATTASRKAMLAGAGVLGFAATLREQNLTHIATLVALAFVAPRRKGTLALIAVGAAVLPLTVLVAGYALCDAGYVAAVHAWFAEMSRERAQHPYTLRDLALYLVWLAALGPVALAAAVASLSRTWRRMLPSSPVFLAVCAPSAVMLLALAGYQDIAFSPRYLVGVFPFAMAIPAARVLDRWQPSRAMGRGVALSVLALALTAAPVLRHVERPLRIALDTLPQRLATVSPRAVIVTGQLCPAVVYRRRLYAHDTSPQRERPDWVQVCPGWRWPSELGQRLDAYMHEGRPVVLDLRDAAWQGPRQRARRDEAARYAATHAHHAQVTVWK
jgi:hypothetical protein